MLVASSVDLESYGRAIIRPLQGKVNVVFESTGQELTLSPETAVFFANALEVQARELGVLELED